MRDPYHVLNFDDPIASDVFSELLDAEGIPYVLKPFADRAYGDLWQQQKGFAALWVEASQAEQVLRLYQAWQASLDTVYEDRPEATR